MAHNFKRISEFTDPYFISKSGHDSNDGLTPDTPKKNIVSGDTRQVIGAGFYDYLPSAYYISGDGKVIIDMKGGAISTFTFFSSDNIEIRNATGASGYSQGAGLNKNIIFKECDLAYVISGREKTFSTSSILNSTLTLNDSSKLSLTSSIIENSTIGVLMTTLSNTLGTYLYDSYVSKSSKVINLRKLGTTFNNFRGLAEFTGVFFNDGLIKQYAFKGSLVGTPQDNDYPTNVKWFNEAALIADGYLADPVGYDLMISNWINEEPLFNNAPIFDFTLQAGSPHIGRAGNGGNLGGTDLAISIINSSGGLGNLEVIPSQEIDTSNPNSYTLKDGYIEGYIDYIQKIGSSPLTLGEISPITLLNFDSDFEGGSLQNNNVPDSEPSTSDYPRTLTTTSNAVDAQSLVINGHNIQLGEFIRVNGEDREVISTTIDTIRVNLVFRGIIPGGVVVQVGSKTNLAALTPNRLTYQLRTSKKETKPVLLSDWENDTDPLYNVSGKFLTQEWGEVPGYVIDSVTNTLYGAGSSSAPRGLGLNEISCRWINLRVFIRNNYNN